MYIGFIRDRGKNYVFNLISLLFAALAPTVFRVLCLLYDGNKIRKAKAKKKDLVTVTVKVFIHFEPLEPTADLC